MHIVVTLLLLAIAFVHPHLAQDTTGVDRQKASQLSEFAVAGIHPDDLRLIETNLNQLSLEQLTEIYRFTTNATLIADSKWFDISGYISWDDYNYYRPIGDMVLSILARRDLFFDPARQLNNRALTNMSSEALAALTFSQVYVEEKWDHEVPWDGDPNEIFNWVHPAITDNPNWFTLRDGDFLYRERVAYWWATYWSLPLMVSFRIGNGTGSDFDLALSGMRPPTSNSPRLAGYSYPLGNQLYLQTAETVYWYGDYLHYGRTRYGEIEPHSLDTGIRFPAGSHEIWQASDSLEARFWLESVPEFALYPGLWGLFAASFGRQLRVELTQPETAAFWNVMRYLYAAARQREGGASPEHPENGQPAVIALRYEERTPQPVGRSTAEVSAFALLTTVYSDSILLDFTNWDVSNNTLIHMPADTARSDGLHRQISERNKAIRVIEQMGNELTYSNATHIAGSRGLGFNLITQYEDAENGDFLPYTAYESRALVMALVSEARDYGIVDSQMTLCNSPLLRTGYEITAENDEVFAWDTLVGDLCG